MTVPCVKKIFYYINILHKYDTDMHLGDRPPTPTNNERFALH